MLITPNLSAVQKYQAQISTKTLNHLQTNTAIFTIISSFEQISGDTIPQTCTNLIFAMPPPSSFI